MSDLKNVHRAGLELDEDVIENTEDESLEKMNLSELKRILRSGLCKIANDETDQDDRIFEKWAEKDWAEIVKEVRMIQFLTCQEC
jgi:hypothetical protein